MRARDTSARSHPGTVRQQRYHMAGAHHLGDSFLSLSRLRSLDDKDSFCQCPTVAYEFEFPDDVLCDTAQIGDNYIDFLHKPGNTGAPPGVTATDRKQFALRKAPVQIPSHALLHPTHQLLDMPGPADFAQSKVEERELSPQDRDADVEGHAYLAVGEGVAMSERSEVVTEKLSQARCDAIF